VAARDGNFLILVWVRANASTMIRAARSHAELGQDCSSAIRALAAAAPILKTLDRPGKAMAQQKVSSPIKLGALAASGGAEL